MEPGSSETQEPVRCYHCDGFLWPDTTLDLHTGVSIHELVCLNCGRRWYPGAPSRAVIAPPTKPQSARRRTGAVTIALDSSSSHSVKSKAGY